MLSPKLPATLCAVAGTALLAPTEATANATVWIDTDRGAVLSLLDPPVPANFLGGVQVRAERFNPVDGFFELVLVGDAALSETYIVIGAAPARIIVHGSVNATPTFNVIVAPGHAGGGAGGNGGNGGPGGEGPPGLAGRDGGQGGVGGAPGGFLFVDGGPGATGGDGVGFNVQLYFNTPGAHGEPGAGGTPGYANTPAPGGTGGRGGDGVNMPLVLPGGIGGFGGDDTNGFTLAPGTEGRAGINGFVMTFPQARGEPGIDGAAGGYANNLDQPVGGTGGGGGGGGGGGTSGYPGIGGGGGGGGGGGEGGSFDSGGRGGNGGKGGDGGRAGDGGDGGNGGRGGNGGGIIDLVVFGPATINGNMTARGDDGLAASPPTAPGLGGNGTPGQAGSPGQQKPNLAGRGGNGGSGGDGARARDGATAAPGGHGGGGAGGTIRVRATNLDLSTIFFNLAGGASPANPGQNGGLKLLTSSTVVGDAQASTNGSIYQSTSAGPTYGPNPYVAGGSDAPLLASTTTGPDAFGLVDIIDLAALIPGVTDAVTITRISGPIPGSNNILRALNASEGPADYLIIANTTDEPINTPALAIGDLNAGPLTPLPLATRGSMLAFQGLPSIPLAQLAPNTVWATTLPASFPADLAIEANGQRFDLQITPGQTINLDFPVPPCNAADLAPPFASLTFADITAFLAAFNQQDPTADLAAPLGAFTFADISAFLVAFSAGCP